MEPIVIRVFGKPEPGGSKIKYRNNIYRDANPKVYAWKADVAFAAKQAGIKVPIESTQPVQARVIFVLPRPKYHYGTGKNTDTLKKQYAQALPVGKPDRTKLWRGTEDALNGIIYHDDSQVVDEGGIKMYELPGLPPGAIITITLADYDSVMSRMLEGENNGR